jgi:hypothetical protein
MSTTGSNQTTRPVSNFTSIFDAALEEYKRLTGKHLHTHPFATAFDVCSTPETILDLQKPSWMYFGDRHGLSMHFIKAMTS